MKLCLLLIAIGLSVVASWAPSSFHTLVRTDRRPRRTFSVGLAKQSLDELPSKRPSTERKKEEDDEEFQLEMKKGALERLDLMLTPTDINDPEYDFIKDQKRTELISSFEYDTLKSILRERGVHSSGNKETLLIRLLLNVIDPDMKYIDGLDEGEQLSYITEDDIKTNKVRVLSPEEIELEDALSLGPDCDDLRVLRKRPSSPISTKDLTDRGPLSTTNYVVGKKIKPFRLMDGLDRSIKAIDTTHVCRTRQEYRRQDRGMDFKLAAYIAHPKIGMRSAKTSFPYVILLPNELGWTSKEMRSLADELSFQCQFPVIVPNIYRSKSAKEVLDKGVRHEQVLDDLIAVVNFMMNTYGYDIFSLAGVGIGGGLALECSADLHAVSLLAITEGLASEIALSTQEIFNNATAQEALVQSAVSKMMIPRYNPFLRRRRYYEGALEVKINLNETGLSIPKEEKQDGKKDEAMVEFLEVLSGEELVELKREEQDKAKMEAEDRDKKDDVIFSDFKVPIKATETEKVEKEEVKEEVKEKDVVPADPLSSEMTSDEVGDFAKVLSSDADLDIMMEEAIKDIAGDYAGDYNTTGTDEEDEEKKEEESLEEKRARAKLGKQHYFEDWELILKLTKRIQSFTPQNTDEYFDDENQVERGLVSEDCSVPMQKLINLAPRSCLAFAPNRFDTQKVSQYLTLPTMIMSTSQETVQHGTLNAIRDLHRSFVLRREEMADFMFRIYNQQSSSFLLSPQDDANRRALMDALILGAVWLSSFNIRNNQELVSTAGQTKMTEGVNFQEVEPHQLLRYIATGIATYLHDDPSFMEEQQ